MGTKLIAGIVLIVLIIWGFSLLKDESELEVKNPNTENVTEGGDEQDVTMMMKDAAASADEMIKEIDSTMMETMMELTYQYVGQLEDVTEGNSSGTASANYNEGQYDLLVTFENLPDLVGTDFYEGWIVRKGLNFDVISSGVIKKVDGVYTNTYASRQDLTDHDFYVLTLEPDDGDPAPAKHILEGTLVN